LLSSDCIKKDLQAVCHLATYTDIKTYLENKNNNRYDIFFFFDK